MTARDDLPLPPHSTHAEQSVLGALMLDSGALARVDGLSAGDFYDGAHRVIFEHAFRLIGEGTPADVTTLAASLDDAGKLDYVGGHVYLGALVDGVPTAANIAHYASIVRDRAQRRQIIATSFDVIRAAHAHDGRDAADIVATAQQEFARAAGADKSNTFPLVWARDAARDFAVDYIAKGILARGELAVIYGAPKSGKTFLAIDLALSVAAGREWFGHRVRAGTVIYVAAEMGRRVERRVRAWMDDRLGDASDHDLPFAVVPFAVNLLDERAVARLLDAIRTIRATRGGPVLVVIDTLARSMTGGDENSAQDMGRALALADLLRDEFNTATLVVHHEGKAANGARGSSALLGAVDTMIRVDHDPKTGARAFEVEWSRDGEAGQRAGFALRSVDLGTDDDGDRLSTCLVEPSDEMPSYDVRRNKGGRPSGSAAVALDALRDAVADFGEPLPATSAIPPGTFGVAIHKWRDRFYFRCPVVAVDDPDERDKATRRRMDRFRSAMDALQGRKQVGVADQWAWIP